MICLQQSQSDNNDFRKACSHIGYVTIKENIRVFGEKKEKAERFSV